MDLDLLRNQGRKMETKTPSLFSTLKKAVYRKTVFWFMDTRLWFNLLKYTIPFIRMTPYYPRLKPLVFQLLYKALRPGDFIFQIDVKKLTAMAIGGEWSHVAYCVDKGAGKVEVVEMTHENFHQTDFFQVCKEGTRIAIGRIDDPKWTEEYNKRFIYNLWEEQDSVYNFNFRAKERIDPRSTQPLRDKNGDKIFKFNYCSQLGTTADTENIIQCNWEDLAGLGVPYISPTGLYKAKNMKIIADSDLL